MTNLPEWMAANLPEDKMLWKGGAIDQMCFVRDRLNGLVQSGIDYEDWAPVKVISTHRSKSIALPVYEMSRPGIRIIARDNFYNWKFSVISERPVDVDLSGLCYTSPPVDREYTGDKLSEVYFEGFPSSLVFGYYDTSAKLRWSAEVYGQEDAYMFVFLVMRAAGAIKPLRYHTRESHRAELDADKARHARRRELVGR